jgi:hypothetical protein
MSNNRSGVPKFGDSEHSFILSKNYAPLQYRLLFQTRQRYHPLSFVFGRLHIVGAI